MTAGPRQTSERDDRHPATTADIACSDGPSRATADIAPRDDRHPDATTDMQGVLDAQARRAEKQRGRDADEHAIRTGERTPAQLRAENEVFAALAARARISLAASRRLG